jgi:hypothetical protein
MPDPVDEFSKHIGTLCVTRDNDIYKLGVETMHLLTTINGWVVPTKAVIAGLARKLDSEVR